MTYFSLEKAAYQRLLSVLMYLFASINGMQPFQFEPTNCPAAGEEPVEQYRKDRAINYGTIAPSSITAASAATKFLLSINHR